MINRLEEAVRSGNVAAVRVALVEAVQNRADKPATLHSMRYAISATPGLFEPDNGRIEILDRESWTNGYVRRMIKAINENFSSEKLSRLLEVCSIMKRRPQEFRRANRAEKKMEQAMAAAEPVEVVEEVASVVDVVLSCSRSRNWIQNLQAKCRALLHRIQHVSAKQDASRGMC